ncbi:MAG: GntR family transcriptional regulator [Bacillota bacterium]
MARRERLYVSIANELAAKIINRELKAGERLKSEPELAEQFNVSRVTIREALGYLENKGMITRRHGLGSFVVGAGHLVAAGLEKMQSFTETIRKAGHVAEDRVLSTSQVNLDPRLAKALEVDPGSPGYLIRSVRTADGTPVILTEDVLRGDLIEDPAFLENRKKHESLLDFLEKELGIRVSYSVMSLSAVQASEEVASTLDVEPGYPLVYLEGVVRDKANRPIYYSTNFFRSDKYQFTLVRARD